MEAREKAALPASARESAARWGELWGLPELHTTVQIELSRRMSKGIGHCYPRRRLIRLASRLLDEDRALFGEALCHELAHVAVADRYGPKPRPHGAEWRALMRAAGYEPRSRLPALHLSVPPTSSRPAGYFLHHCPVCQASRLARRPVRRWRCAACG